MKNLLTLLLAISADIFGATYLYKAWGWFITPTFGMNAPNIATIFGLILIYTFFKGFKKREDEDVIDLIAYKFCAIFTLFVLSWITSIFA